MLTLGVSSEVTESTRLGVYGFKTSCNSEDGCGALQRNLTVLHVFIQPDGLKEVKMNSISLAPMTSPARLRPGPGEESVPSFYTQGDSGAMVFDLATNRIIDMVIAAYGTLTIIMSIDEILAKLGAKYVVV